MFAPAGVNEINAHYNGRSAKVRVVVDAAAAARLQRDLSARQAARELEMMLGERGVGGQLVRADQPASDMSVLSVCRGLTVWCGSGVLCAR